MKGLENQMPATFDGVVLWAALTLAFFCCLRAPELCVTAPGFDEKTNWCLSDVKMNSDGSAMYVNVQTSKTDTSTMDLLFPLADCSYFSVCALF